jgi:hypothetical protein
MERLSKGRWNRNRDLWIAWCIWCIGLEMRIENERRLGREEREARRGETCITRTGLRPYDTLTGLNVVSLRNTGAATLVFS